MKKRNKFVALIMAIAMAAGLAGCGGGNGGNGANSDLIDKVELQKVEGFAEENLPDVGSIAQQEGQVDVILLFEGTEAGWQALADEYMRIQGGYVTVKLDTTYTSTSIYTDKLRSEIQGETNWDIVQGNLIDGGVISSVCLNMSSWVTGTNAYAGANKVWKDVLTENAYITDISGANSDCYILNSENLQTAWFVNSVAMKAAADKGYVNAEGKAENPITWDDLMLLCEKMVEAGYSSPLGISVADDAITASQFAWLMRVYGDQYYRQEYENVFAIEGDATYIENEYELDLSSQNPEADADFNISPTRLYNSILDDSISNSTYVGATSDKFAEFLEQFYKMRPYLRADAASMTFEDMRNMFTTQSKGKDSPQIILDYAGSGLGFLDSQAAEFEIDFFDYPAMVGDYVSEDAMVRDVGGNGGYLSIVRHDDAQNALNQDFMKFVMSPYGQTIYYKALAENNCNVKGLTTVKTDTVVVPQKWIDFFATDKISFNGLADSNTYVGNLVMYIGDDKVACQTVSKNLWKQYLTGTGADAIETEDFQEEWLDALLSGWKVTCKNRGFSEECYLYPGKGTDYTN